jgi:ATP-binding cassette subfamily F protein uup
LRGDRLGLIGPNGAGKSTLLKLIVGALAPDAGHVRLGTRLTIAYFDQMRAALDPARTLQDTISPGSEWVDIAGVRKHVASYLGDFLFAPERAQAPVRTLSGGERNRLLLARLFAQPANLLVMDEPTNDLDIESLELLEATLQSYAGTLLLVSHDRRFLDNVVTQTLVAEGGGKWQEYAGGYSDWVALRPRSPPVARERKPRAVSAQPVRERQRTGLTFREQRELEALPAELEALEEEQRALTQRMCAPDYHRQEVAQIKADRQRALEMERLLAEKFERWGDLDARNTTNR